MSYFNTCLIAAPVVYAVLCWVCTGCRLRSDDVCQGWKYEDKVLCWLFSPLWTTALLIINSLIVTTTLAMYPLSCGLVRPPWELSKNYFPVRVLE